MHRILFFIVWIVFSITITDIQPEETMESQLSLASSPFPLVAITLDTPDGTPDVDGAVKEVDEVDVAVGDDCEDQGKEVDNEEGSSSSILGGETNHGGGDVSSGPNAPRPRTTKVMTMKVVVVSDRDDSSPFKSDDESHDKELEAYRPRQRSIRGTSRVRARGQL